MSELATKAQNKLEVDLTESAPFKMDTLSRKHRLRQQQLQQQRRNQQVLYESTCGGKENQLERQEQSFSFSHQEYDAGLRVTSQASNNNDSEEQFRVFKLVEIGQQEADSRRDLAATREEQFNANKAIVGNASQATQRRRQQQVIGEVRKANNSNNNARNVASLTNNRKNQFRDNDCDEVFQSNVYVPSREQHSTGCSTTRSTAAYSSGFASEESSDRFQQSIGVGTEGSNNHGCSDDDLDVGFAARCANKLRQHSRQRSRVIADLDRLMMNVGRTSTSPAESYLSNGEPTATSDSRHAANEFDYSTLCRDEFSSFIPVNSRPIDGLARSSVDRTLTEPIRVQVNVQKPMGGPVLVGVHNESNDCARLESYHSSENSYSGGSDVYELQHESSSCITSSSRNDTETSVDKELVVVNDQFSDTNSIKLSTDDNLSEMLDVYLERVESLLRLSRGDKTVSLKEAFGGDEIEVSEEFKTGIEFSPIQQKHPKTRVLQEVKMIEMTLDDEEEEESQQVQCDIERKVIEADFKAMLFASPQTSAKLSWGQESIDIPVKQTNSDNSQEDFVQQRERLESSILNRLLDDDFKIANTSSDLVNAVKRHVSEFVENYNSYQKELKAETSFATDWHQNWLFAFKRPPELAPAGRDGGAKRARMSSTECYDDNFEPNLVSERSATNQMDLIKYSTLILSKFKPVKLTYLTTKTSQNIEEGCEKADRMIRESIEACYEAQELRLKELQVLALETSRQTDACRLLLCEFDDDDEDGDSGSDYYDEDDESNDHSNQRVRYGKLKRKCSARGKRLIRKGRALLISYDSSLLIQKCAGNKFTFSSYGYLFQCKIATFEGFCLSEEKSRRMREEILRKLKEKVRFNKSATTTTTNCDNNAKAIARNERIKFLVGAKNVALVNTLPVIQFCVKVSGSLPIKVSWFRVDDEEEISSIHNTGTDQRAARRSRTKIREGSIGVAQVDWPIEMQANFDYEYQTEWSSWLRFKRCQGDILFEIRDGNLEKDYNKTYKCVVENYCSREECSFSLTKRATSPEIYSTDNKLLSNLKSFSKNKSSSSSNRAYGKDNNHALLRTWSQRTLHKPQPQTTMPNKYSVGNKLETNSQQQVPVNVSTSNSNSNSTTIRDEDANKVEKEGEEDCEENNNLLNRRSTQTVGRLSATVAATCEVEDKFGLNFPYHPENLLKRLEQNKFSVPLKYKLQVQHDNAGQAVLEMATCESASKFNNETSSEATLSHHHCDEEVGTASASTSSHLPTISPQIYSTNNKSSSPAPTQSDIETMHDELLKQQAEHCNRLPSVSLRQPTNEQVGEDDQEEEEEEEVQNYMKDAKLTEDESTNELTNSFSQVSE